VTLALLTVREAADALGRSRAFVEARMREGKLPCLWEGGRRYVPRSALEAYIRGAARAQPPPEPVAVAPEVWR
jgi:excisionase family DNA binding protein